MTEERYIYIAAATRAQGVYDLGIIGQLETSRSSVFLCRRKSHLAAIRHAGWGGPTGQSSSTMSCLAIVLAMPRTCRSQEVEGHISRQP